MSAYKSFTHFLRKFIFAKWVFYSTKNSIFFVRSDRNCGLCLKFFKANYGQIHNSFNQFDKGYIRRLPVISLAEPCSARWTCLHGDGFPVFWDGRSFFIRFYKPRALHSLGNQRSAEPQGGYKDGSTAFKRYVTVAQPEELSLPSQNAPTTLFTFKMSIVSLLSSLYYSPDKYLLTASRGLTTLKIIKPYGI